MTTTNELAIALRELCLRLMGVGQGAEQENVIGFLLNLLPEVPKVEPKDSHRPLSPFPPSLKAEFGGVEAAMALKLGTRDSGPGEIRRRLHRGIADGRVSAKIVNSLVWDEQAA